MTPITETTRQGWGSRIKGSIKGIFFGFLLLFGGCYLLFWGEGRAVKRKKALTEGAGVVVSVASDSVQSQNEGRLIHLSGDTATEETLKDEEFGVEAPQSFQLERKVEMYQWIEDKDSTTYKKAAGSTETTTTYSYRKDWSSSSHDSSDFKESAGHENPPFLRRAESWSAQTITLGAFTLGDAFRGRVGNSERISPESLNAEAIAQVLGQPVFVNADRLYVGANPGAPSVGDLKINWSRTAPELVSLIGAQRSNLIESYQTSNGNSIDLVASGHKPADAMFKQAQESNKTLAWILRAVGFFLIFIGFRSILGPISVLADVIPFLGNLAEKGLGFISFILAGMTSLVVIAIGWIFYRPLFGISLLILAGGLAYWLWKRTRTPGVVVPPPPPPPPLAPPVG